MICVIVLLFLELRNHSDEARLRLILLDGYVPQARPVVNTTNATIVDVGLTIIQVMDLVSDSMSVGFSHLLRDFSIVILG